MTDLETNGWDWIRSAVSLEACHRLAGLLDSVFAESASTLRHGTNIYGARNLIQICPVSIEWLEEPRVREVCQALLGGECGIVRGLYFDKPPGSSWTLPWHQDLTIAVKDNRLPSSNFSHPTRKAAVDHVEAPTWLLESMLTLRLHLDAMTSENGPLLVRPGTHRQGKLRESQAPASSAVQELHCQAGDCLIMRPLLSHSSRLSDENCMLHRRVVHIELSSVRDLPDKYQWNLFRPL